MRSRTVSGYSTRIHVRGEFSGSNPDTKDCSHSAISMIEHRENKRWRVIFQWNVHGLARMLVL